MEELQQRRAELLISTREEEGERARVSQDLAALQRRLAHLDASLERKRVSHAGWQLHAALSGDDGSYQACMWRRSSWWRSTAVHSCRPGSINANIGPSVCLGLPLSVPELPPHPTDDAIQQAGREALERVISQAQAALDKLAESSGLCLAVTRRNAQEVGLQGFAQAG